MALVSPRCRFVNSLGRVYVCLHVRHGCCLPCLQSIANELLEQFSRGRDLTKLWFIWTVGGRSCVVWVWFCHMGSGGCSADLVFDASCHVVSCRVPCASARHYEQSLQRCCCDLLLLLTFIRSSVYRLSLVALEAGTQKSPIARPSNALNYWNLHDYSPSL